MNGFKWFNGLGNGSKMLVVVGVILVLALVLGQTGVMDRVPVE